MRVTKACGVVEMETTPTQKKLPIGVDPPLVTFGWYVGSTDDLAGMWLPVLLLPGTTTRFNLQYDSSIL